MRADMIESGRISARRRSGGAEISTPIEPGATPLRLRRTMGSLPVQRVRGGVLYAPTPSTREALTVLGGVKRPLAPLTGSAALDPACAR